MAARGGSREVFQQALTVLEELYTDDQVRTVYIFGVDILKTEGLSGGLDRIISVIESIICFIASSYVFRTVHVP